MIKKISMHDFTQATHAFSAQLILTNNNLCRIPPPVKRDLITFFALQSYLRNRRFGYVY